MEVVDIMNEIFTHEKFPSLTSKASKLAIQNYFLKWLPPFVY